MVIVGLPPSSESRCCPRENPVSEIHRCPLDEILRKDGICVCAKCGYLGTGSEFTVSNYPADDYSSACPKCDNTDEDLLVSAESVSPKLSPAAPDDGKQSGDEIRKRLLKLADNWDSPKVSLDGEYVAEEIRKALHG
jgi:hypothetical protein